jgi:hypothetical protein
MSVRLLIRKQVKRSPSSASPAAISAAVVRALPEDELRPALRLALPYLVRDEVRKLRHNAIGAASPRGRYAWRDPEPAMPPAALSGAQRRAAAQRASDAAQAKIEREQALLATPLMIDRGRWKPLGDCTPTDLRTVAKGNRARAAENTERAAIYERLADDMDAKGIALVRDYERVDLVRQAIAA